MARQIHLTNAAGRDATVAYEGLQPPAPPAPGFAGKTVEFVRFLAAAEEGLHERLVAAHGADYGQALVDGDPELDLEQIGRRIGRTDTVYLSAEGAVLYAPPSVLEIVLDPHGDEKARRVPDDVEANVNDESPVRWTGRKMPIDQVVRRFAIRRTLQVRHVDGLTYDYLFAMAQELSGSEQMVMLGSGEGGRKPLIFQTNGTPYRAFLEGRVDGERYMLLLHLSNMEIKRPPVKPEEAR
jgi:hypothetical protein